LTGKPSVYCYATIVSRGLFSGADQDRKSHNRSDSSKDGQECFWCCAKTAAAFSSIASPFKLVTTV
jgi:hypothetical protein